MSIKTNTASLQNLLDAVNNLPEAGTDLPELSNEGSASDLLSGKQLIDSDGNVVTGTFTIDSELNTQDSLISQIQTALAGKAGGSAAPTLQEKTVTPSTSKQTVAPDSNYDGLSKVTVNAMPTATQATPSISVNSSGLITASATQTAGYVAAGTKSATKQLTTKAATTYTPTTSDQTIAAGTYCSGVQTIKGDANLVAGNIKKGVSVFGVNGSYEGSGGSSGDGSVETVDVYIKIADVYMSGLVATELMYTSIENGVIIYRHGSTNDILQRTTTTTHTKPGYYTGTLSCVVGSAFYLVDSNIMYPSITSSNTTIEIVGDYETIYAVPITSLTTSIIADAS